MVRPVIVATVCFFGAVVFSSANAEKGPSPQAQADQEIRAIELKWIQAENDHDAETLRSILHKDFQASTADGALVGRETFIANVTGDPARPSLSQDLSDRHMVVNGDTAVVLENDTVRGTNEGKPFSFVLRLTETWVKRDSRWQAIAMHAQFLPPPAGK